MKASLLWGAVGVLAFLVLLQGYELWSGYRYTLAVKFGVAFGVGAGGSALSYVGQTWLFEQKERV